MRIDPGRLDLEQSRELAGMRREDSRGIPLDRFEGEERVCIDDRRQLGLLQQPPDELSRFVPAAEPRPECKRLGALRRLERLFEWPFDRLEQPRLDDR
jgi:hypothetical protein